MRLAFHLTIFIIIDISSTAVQLLPSNPISLKRILPFSSITNFVGIPDTLLSFTTLLTLVSGSLVSITTSKPYFMPVIKALSSVTVTGVRSQV